MSRPLVLLLAGFSMGVLAAVETSAKPLNWWFVFLLAGTGVLFFRPVWRPAGIALLVFISGFWWAFHRYPAGEIPVTSVSIRGTLLSARKLSESKWEVILLVRQIETPVGTERVRWKARAYLAGSDTAPGWPGDMIRWTGVRLRQLAGPGSETTRFSNFWKSRGVWIGLIVTGRDRWENSGGSLKTIRGRLERWRHTLSAHLSQGAFSPANRSVLDAMLLGERMELDPETRRLFIRAGLAHMLTVSGLHVGVVFLLIYRLLRLFKRVLHPFVRLIILLLPVWGYAGLTGMGPAVIRAAGMLSLYQIALSFRYRIKPFQVLGVVAFFQLLLNPLSFYQSGTQMSYLAVGGILYGFPKLAPWFSRVLKIRLLANIMALSVSAQVLLVPIILYYFRQYSLYSLLSNLLVMPLLLLVFYAAVFWMAMSMAGWTWYGFSILIDRLMSAAIGCAGWMGRLPGNVWHPDRWNFLDLAGWYFICLMIILYIQHRSIIRFKRIIWMIMCLSGINLVQQLLAASI
ncbi:MAG: ComEC/Rec2 family competence protein [Bacteroidales bacterium]|nr:ComEC/Rec2 family competence protein [Bacteroidales bacterium]